MRPPHFDDNNILQIRCGVEEKHLANNGIVYFWVISNFLTSPLTDKTS